MIKIHEYGVSRNRTLLGFAFLSAVSYVVEHSRNERSVVKSL